MKKSILILLIALNLSAICQEKTTIGKIQHATCEKSDDNYFLVYRDYSYFEIIQLKSFKLTEAEFNNLFNSIQEGFKNVPEDGIQIETAEDILILKFTKVIGVINLQITQFVNKNYRVTGVTKYLTRRSAFKLFGKKK